MSSSPGPEELPEKELFTSVCYIIASSLPGERADQLRHILDINGAVYLEKGLVDTTLNTIITNSNRFEGWEDAARRQNIRVVSDKWVERSVVLGKLQPVQYFSPDPAMIFSGVVACASDLPSTDLEVLSAGITALGGQWRTGLTRDTTHLFALSPDSAKYATAMHYREETGIRVVLPHWFDDAIRLGLGNLPTKSYEWPDPELLKGADRLFSENENIKAKGKAALVELERNNIKRNMYATAVIFTPSLGRSSPPAESDISLVLRVPGQNNVPLDSSPQQTQVWKGRKFVLSRTLELYQGRREAVQAGIERAGGVILRFEGDEDEPEPFPDHPRQSDEKLSKKERVRRRKEAQRIVDCDVLVTRWRHGRAYVRACEGGKLVGTLAWLFHVQSSGVLSNPQDQLLHYPVPKRNIEGFSNHVITVTNYTGEAREYIKKLIAAMGATFTPSMSGENTALIAAYLGGTKADKAQSWSIPIVNHTWIEDCFVQWRNLTMALEKYIVFPPGVNFSCLLGERGVGVGNQVVKEVEELATVVYEEDENYLSDDCGKDKAVDNLGVAIPNGTGESVRQDEVPDSKQIVNVRSKVGEQVERFLELSSEEDLPKKKSKGEESREGNMSSDEEEDEETVEQVKTRTSSKVHLVSAPVKTRFDDAQPEKPSNSVNSRVSVLDSEDNRKGTVVSSNLVSTSKKGDRETADDVEPVEEKPEAGLRRKLTVEVVMKSPPKGKERKVRGSGDDINLMQESKKVRSIVTPSANKVAGARQGGLLTKAKADPRTRIKRKSFSKEGYLTIESEEEDSVVQSKNKKHSHKVQREEVSKEEERRPSKPKPRAQPASSKNGEKTKTPVRLKPLRVYSSDDVESEDHETSSRVADQDLESEEDLPETIVLPSGSQAKTGDIVRTSDKAVTSRRRKSDIEEQVVAVKSLSKQGREPTVAPKRTISVLSPPSAISRGKGKKKAHHDADEVVAVHRSGKSKSKTQIPVSDSESADELNEIRISPRRSGLTKSKSVKAKVGQSSLRDVIDSGQKPKQQEKRQRRSYGASELRKVSEVGRMESMDIDDDHNLRSSPTSDSGPDMPPRRRNAAANALHRLHDTLMPDLVNFEAQMKKAKGRSRQSAGSLTAFALDFEEERRDVGKRKNAAQIEEGGDASDEEVQPRKKRRMSDENENIVKVKGKLKGKQKAKEDSVEIEGRKTSSSVVLQTTQVTLPDDVLKSLAKLGVRMTTRSSECTHLLCPHLVRTEKFLCALPHAPFILSAEWATASAAAKMLLPEKEFILHDVAGEKKYGIDLAHALRRAKANKGKLLEGKMFYLTPRVNVDKKLLKNVVNACGGDVTNQQPSLRIIRASPENRHVISCNEDISIWRPIAVEGYKIYTQELLLAGVMKQEIEWDREEFMLEPL